MTGPPSLAEVTGLAELRRAVARYDETVAEAATAVVRDLARCRVVRAARHVIDTADRADPLTIPDALVARAVVARGHARDHGGIGAAMHAALAAVAHDLAALVGPQTCGPQTCGAPTCGAPTWRAPTCPMGSRSPVRQQVSSVNRRHTMTDRPDPADTESTWTVDSDGRAVYPLSDRDGRSGRAIYIGPGTFGVLLLDPISESESRAAHAALVAALADCPHRVTDPTADGSAP